MFLSVLPRQITWVGYLLLLLVSDDLTQMEQNLAQTYKDNMTLVTQSLEQYKNEMAIFQKKYDMLRDDYQYNLEVIKERDEELKKYDTYVASLREVFAFWVYHGVENEPDEAKRESIC